MASNLTHPDPKVYPPTPSPVKKNNKKKTHHKFPGGLPPPPHGSASRTKGEIGREWPRMAFKYQLVLGRHFGQKLEKLCLGSQEPRGCLPLKIVQGTPVFKAYRTFFSWGRTLGLLPPYSCLSTTRTKVCGLQFVS